MVGSVSEVVMLLERGSGISEARSWMNWLTVDVEYPVMAHGRHSWVGMLGTVIDE
jgi:hypothetical protein